MKNIHLLPTDKPSSLHLAYNKDYYLSVEPFIQLDTKNYKSFNINITNDEEIKEGDWYLKANTNLPVKRIHLGNNIYKEDKKIILTTDIELAEDGVQIIDDEFLEWFVFKTNDSGKPIDIVEVEKCYTRISEAFYGYEIIIPKEETLEEVAERLYPYEIGYGVYDRNCEIDFERERFINGAKWQQEQDKNKFSEEEVLELLNSFNKHTLQLQKLKLGNSFYVKDWFEQFKKK